MVKPMGDALKPDYIEIERGMLLEPGERHSHSVTCLAVSMPSIWRSWARTSSETGWSSLRIMRAPCPCPSRPRCMPAMLTPASPRRVPTLPITPGAVGVLGDEHRAVRIDVHAEFVDVEDTRLIAAEDGAGDFAGLATRSGDAHGEVEAGISAVAFARAFAFQHFDAAPLG